MAEPLLRVDDLKVHFPVKTGAMFRRQVAAVRAVHGVSLTLARGETLGLVGESGCGKSTPRLATMRMLTPTAAPIEFEAQDITLYAHNTIRPPPPRHHAIYHDPY